MESPELAAVTVFTVGTLVAWSPLLSIERLRALFSAPTAYFPLNYAIVGCGLCVIQCISYLGVLVLTVGTDMVTGSDVATILGGVFAVNLLVPTVGALVAVSVLSPRGHWSPDGTGIGGRIALALGVLWYAVVTSALFVLIGFAVVVTNLPT
ncbi:hypothetical protein [Halostagnicola kamekurae]|uniref:DUF8162 domain-containing protein n=1 Tax=Halostagnicola kamekurae TaxID=619731 RepID=A0A1I6TG81_9EURY|nr:hypothetical protein [Halostagnicola kamekurae]SFS88128.1 hypothetical protein SAMN04488556_3089 [Halostagnicola kamekurae]